MQQRLIFLVFLLITIKLTNAYVSFSEPKQIKNMNIIYPLYTTFIVITNLFSPAQSILETNVDELFTRIHKVSSSVLTRLEHQTALKQEYLLSVTLSFTLLECLLLITSLILHAVSVALLKKSHIFTS